MTFFATASAVVLAGGVPVFCDVDPKTFLIDLDDAATRISDRTRAMCPVYLFGQPLDATVVGEFAARYELAMVGDAAQSLGSMWQGRHVGAEAALTTHSFYPTKNLFVGEGGMVTTDDAELDSLGRLLRSHGQGRKYHHSHIGLNYRMTDVEAAIGRAQLPKLDARNDRRRSIAATYDAAFADLDGIATPYVPAGAHHTYHQYTLTINRELVGDRDDFASALAAGGVGSQINYPMSLHRQEVFTDRLGIDGGPLPVCEELCRTVLSIPVHHHLADRDVQQVVDVVIDATTTKAKSRRVR
jgi:perosamine synthetase